MNLSELDDQEELTPSMPEAESENNPEETYPGDLDSSPQLEGEAGILSQIDEHEDGRAWYVVHCYSGYENKVRHNLEQRIETMGMKDMIF